MASAYSPSRIATYENCPLKFKFRYVDRRPALRGTIEAFLGQRVHEALEKVYRDRQFHKEVSLDEVLDFYRQRWDREMDDTICVVKEGYSPDNYRRMGEEYLHQYYRRYHPFDQGTTIALEKLVSLPIGEGYTVRGYIDRLTEKDGVYEVHDYKTSLTLPTQEDLATDRQLPLYALAVKHLYDDAEQLEMVWHYVAFDKELRLSTQPDRLESVRQETLAKIREIEQAIAREEFPPRQSALCPYCEYQELCPLFKHQHRLEQLPPAEARCEDGRTLVNRYVEVDSKIKELERIKESLKEQLVTYAEENDLQLVYGTSQIANVRVYRNAWFPGVKDPRRNDLEDLLRGQNLYQRFSQLDVIALSKAYERGQFPQPVQERLADFATTKTVTRIYLRQREEE
ncbi:MAG TPA: PD-(D/E)XK nuclease family protein [Thermoplasmatales archaeon]|nr:PD-(D/E)XK nuclease family protein [Thermoplasmatales archaeon]